MLLQHELGVLRIFPDWPSSMDASFKRLRAKGAFLVSSEQHSGTVVFIDITAEHGGALTLQSPWGSRAVNIDGRTLTGDSAGQLRLNFAPGAHHHLEPR